MRIAYVSLHWPRSAESSIGKKIIQQTTAWRAAGHTVQFFSHMHPSEKPEKLVDGLRFKYGIKKGGLGSFISEFNRAGAAVKLVKAVAAYHPDIIYLRWAMYVFPIQRLFSLAPVAVEINTRDINEHRLLGALHSLYNRLTRGIILGSAAGHVFASRELMDLPDFSKYNKPGVVVSNGIDLQNTFFYPAPNNTPPRLVFIGTPGMPWHGVEKLVHLASAFPDLIIDVIGQNEIKGIASPPGNLVFHGFLTDTAYEKVLAGADAAIGTLALHVKGMQEAAPLKIRDCAARGIPCILPYLDSDLAGLKSSLFLEIPNTPDVITTHGEVIHEFVLKSRGQRVPREMVLNHIDIHVKEKQRLDFFEKLLANR